MGTPSARVALTRREQLPLPGQRAATVLGAAVVALLAASVPLAALTHQLGGGSSLILVIAFVVVGTVVARHQPRNPIGWSMLAASGFLALSADASLYSVLDYRQRHGSLPLGPVAVLLQPTWAPAIFLFALSIVLFPDGELPSGRWRWPIGLLVALGTAWLAGAFAIAATTILGHRIQIESGGDLVAIDHARGGFAWWPSVQSAFFILLASVGLAWLASRVPAYRRSSGERRQQLKWLLCGGIAAVIGGVATVLFSNSGGALGLFGRVAVVGLLGLPLGIGIGILKYRLYEIDRLISRTLSYTLLTALLVGVFTGLVLLTTRVLPFSSPVGVAASTLVAAALVNPLRGRPPLHREFQAAVRRDGDLAVLDLSGQISAAAESGLEEAYAEVAGEPKVLLDFADVDYINSTGIALIVGILAEARKKGQELQAGGLAEHYREIFRITRLSDFMTILDDQETRG